MSVEFDLRRAEKLDSSGKSAESVALLDALSAQYPDDFRVYFQRAMCKNRLRDREGAVADMTIAIGLNPDEPASLFFRGRWHIESGDYLRGIEDMRAAIVADEDANSEYYACPARFVVAVAHYLSGDRAAARQACRGLPADSQTYLARRVWKLTDIIK